VVPESCFVAENATLIGQLSMGENCSIWYNAVLRADVHFIKLGDSVNIQDNAVVHCTFEKSPTTIGNFVSVGHNAIVHGCTIEDKVLIGMGSIVMDDCIVESKSIIAAGAVLTKGTRVSSGSIYAGIPAKKIGEVSPDLQKHEIERIANNYKTYASWFREEQE
jgi:carbonic anhydrase/acetyltransferase-like protein (isoleucine patch superfamily)